MPSKMPTGAPTTDPCETFGCSSDCNGTLSVRGGSFDCGWNGEFDKCRAGFWTTLSERAQMLEAFPGGCAHKTTPPTRSPSRSTASPTVSPTISPTYDRCLAVRCSKDCNNVTHTVAEVTIVLHSCGWDAESNTCQKGYVTSKGERNALLEADPGACRHHTLAPTLTPTARPSAAPAVTPTNNPTGVGDVNYPTVMLFTSGDIDLLTSTQRKELETAVRRQFLISFDVTDESIVEVQFRTNYRRSRSFVFTIAVLLELGPISFDKVRRISELVNAGNSLVIESFGQHFRSFASSFLLTKRVASTTPASMEMPPTPFATRRATTPPPINVDETDVEESRAAENDSDTALGLIIGIFLTLTLLVGLIIMNTLRKDRILKGINKSVPQSVIDDLRDENRRDIEAAMNHISPLAAASQKVKAALSPTAMHRLRHVQMSDAEYAVQWLDHIDGDEMDDIWEQCDEGGLVESAGPMPYSSSFGSTNPDTFQKGNIFDRAHIGRTGQIRHTDESTVSWVSDTTSTIPTYDALRSQFTAAVEKNSADRRDKSAEVQVSWRPSPDQMKAPHTPSHNHPHPEAMYLALTSDNHVPLQASDFDDYDQVNIDMATDSRQKSRRAYPVDVGYEGIGDAQYDIVGRIAPVDPSLASYDNRDAIGPVAGSNVYDLADAPGSTVGSDYGPRQHVASRKLRVYDERYGAPLSPPSPLPLPSNYDVCGAETSHSASTLIINDTGNSQCSSEPPIVANYGGYDPPVLAPNGRPRISASFKTDDNKPHHRR